MDLSAESQSLYLVDLLGLNFEKKTNDNNKAYIT